MDQWYVARGKVRAGPYSRAQLQALAGKGELRLSDMLLQQGTQRWIGAGKVPDLFPATSAVRPPLPTERGAAVATPAAAPTQPAAPPPLPVSSAFGAYGPRSRPRLWIAAGITCLCTLAVAVLLMRGSSDRSKNSDQVVQSEGKAPPEEPAPNEPARNDPSKVEGLVPGAPVVFSSDLDEIVYLLSQGVYISGDVGSQDKLIARATETHWVRAMERLRSSRDPAVAAAAAASHPAAARRAGALDVQEKLAADLKAIQEKLMEDNKGLPTIFDAAFSPLPSESDLAEVERRGDISSTTANAYRAERALRDQAAANAWAAAAKTTAARTQANQQVDALRLGLDVLDADVVADKLVGPLRARAGAKVAQAPLKVTAEGETLVSAVSRSERELTRLTLLIELDTPWGWRFMSAYVPRLGPSESFRIKPAHWKLFEKRAPPGQELHKPPGHGPWNPIAGKTVSRLRYSVWCDQFQFEQAELATVVDATVVHEAVLAYGIHLAQPGTAYILASRGKPVALTLPRLTFTKLTPSANGYDVEAEITRFDQKDPSRVLSTEKYTGTARGTSTTKYALLFTLSSPAGRDNLVLELVVDINGRTAGELSWNIRSAPKGLPVASYLVFAKEFEKHVKLNEQLTTARKLAIDGHKSEAAKLLKELLDTSPGEPWQGNANRMLKELDKFVELGVRLRKGK